MRSNGIVGITCRQAGRQAGIDVHTHTKHAHALVACILKVVRAHTHTRQCTICILMQMIMLVHGLPLSAYRANGIGLQLGEFMRPEWQCEMCNGGGVQM